jgi:phosphatidate cytidylyltransferase
LRVVSAVVLGPLALLCAWVGGAVWYALLVITFAGVCWEWWGLCRGRHAAILLAGLVYAAAAVLALGWLRSGADGRLVLFFLLVVVWCSDIGAYMAGRLIGGPRLAPAISPGKTWSGSAGGLVAAVLGGVVVVAIGHRTGQGTLAAIPIAAVLGIVSQIGDLGESWLKRQFGVKDSGKLIPGHGGLLDRLDGLMAAALAASIWALAAGPGMLSG